MTPPNLYLANLPRSLEAMTNGELIGLCDEPEFLARCTQLEFELIIRLGAEMEVNESIENELQTDVGRLAKYESKRAVAARMKTAAAQLEAIIRERN